MTKKDMIIILENTFIEYYSACVIYSRLEQKASSHTARAEYERLHKKYMDKLNAHTNLLIDLGMIKRLPELRRAGAYKANNN